MKFTIFLLFTIYFSAFAIPFANAESISLAIDPPIFQISATPPANILSPFTIENRGDLPLDLRIEFKPFIPSDREDGQVRYVKESEANLVDPLFFQRISILNESGEVIKDLRLEGKQKKNLNLSINLPKDSLSSDYYFSIVFLSSKTSANNTSSSENLFGLASNVLLSVGAGKVTGEIAEFSAPVFLEKGPVPFTLRIKNTSNHFITPKGEILIKNVFGQTIGRVDLQETNILAGSVRMIPSSDSENLTANWPQNLILGPYKASLSVALSDTGPLFRRNVLFFAFPLQILGGIFIGLIFLVFIAIKVKSKV